MVSTKIEQIPLKKIFTSEFKIISDKNLSEIDSSESTSEIALSYLHVIRVLQLSGFVPLQVKKKGSKIFYEHKILSLEFFFCWFSLSLLFSVHGLFILNRMLQIDWPIKLFRHAEEQNGLLTQGLNSSDIGSQGPNTVKNIESMFLILFPTLAIACSAFARFQYRILVDFMQNWDIFLEDYNKCFSSLHRYKFKFNSMRTIAAILLFGCAALYFLTPLTSKLLVTDNFLWNAMMTIMYIGSIAGPWFLTGIFTSISLQSFITGYREIRTGIELQYKAMSHDVSYTQVKSWIWLVSSVRSQIRRYEMYIGSSELVDLLSTFIIVLGSSYAAFSVLLNGNQGGDGNTLIPLAASMTLFGFLRTYTKGYFSERVTEEEEKIASLVMSMKSNDSRCQTRLQMTILSDMILHNPIKITFGNVIVVNRRLVLSIISQIAAYLVVFLQFKN